jgi:hypothetical protein
MMNVKSVSFFEKVAKMLSSKDEAVSPEDLECLLPEEFDDLVREHLGGDFLPEHNYTTFNADDLQYHDDLEELHRLFADEEVSQLELNHFLMKVQANKKNYPSKFVNMLKKAMYIE